MKFKFQTIKTTLHNSMGRLLAQRNKLPAPKQKNEKCNLLTKLGRFGRKNKLA